MGFAGPVDAASAREIGIEKEHFIAAGELAKGIGWSDGLIDQVAKPVAEETGGNAKAAATEKLIQADVEGAAALGAQRGSARIAGIGAEGFKNSRLFDPLTVRNSSAGVAPKALGIAQSQDRTHPGHDACAEIGVRFPASASAER